MAEENEPVTGSRREGASGRRLDAAHDIAILDYVMLDFGDDALALPENDRQGTMTEPWRRV